VPPAGDPGAAGGPAGDLAARVAEVTGAPPRRVQPAGGQHRWQHCRVTLATGEQAFAKVAATGLDGVFEAEAAGLRWLAEAGAVPVPRVLGAGPGALVVSWVDGEPASRDAAERFGRDLARLHAAGADGFGAPWAGFIASLPLPNEPGGSWPEWYAARRLLPFARRAVDAGALGPDGARLVEEVAGRLTALAGPAEPPARLHGDCWSGNVLWSGGRGVLIDPAAHGGHRESDLAMLALFGAPYLDRILAAYHEVAPLAEGWRQRVPLHQLHPLLVHACLFGAGYAGPVLHTARAALAAGG